MARKDSLIYKQLGVSLATSFNSTPTIVRNLDNCSYQINVTTTDSVGTFALQGSNDYSTTAQSPNNGGNTAGTWVTLPIGGTPSVSAANDQIMIDINQFPFEALRIAYTSSTAGTGTCNIILVARQLGG